MGRSEHKLHNSMWGLIACKNNIEQGNNYIKFVEQIT